MRPITEQVLTTTVTRAEFADALGMRETDLFVERMFACVARRHSDKICFQEFLQVVARFSNGEKEILRAFAFLSLIRNAPIVTQQPTRESFRITEGKTGPGV